MFHDTPQSIAIPKRLKERSTVVLGLHDPGLAAEQCGCPQQVMGSALRENWLYSPLTVGTWLKLLISVSLNFFTYNLWAIISTL